MNDNLIKMFIGGEEVVSNKEFTINEEMLSASSTILNNCYPASWEESKDYVSNFYYPKDYSKYILGKGNFTYGTDQYYILTISGSNFIQFTTNVEKEFAGFTVYGNTTQKTRQGYNLVQISNTFRAGSSATGITPSVTANNELQVVATSSNGNWHTNWWAANQSFNNIENTLNTGDTFTISFTIKKTANSTGKPTIYIKAGMGYYGMIGNVSTEYSEIYYTGIWNDNNGLAFHLGWGGCVGTFTIKNWQLKKGNYQPYEEFGAMPSPDYPSELVSVGYQNLFDSATFEANLVSGKIRNDSGTVVNDSTSTYSTYMMPIKANKKYNIKGFLQRVYLLNSSGTFVSRIIYNSSNTLPMNTTYIPTIDGYFQFQIRNDIYNSNKGEEFVYVGTQEHSYIPYGKYGVEVVSQGSNYFDATKITNTSISVSQDGKEIVMPVATSGNGLTGAGAKLKDLAPNLKVGDTVYLYFERNGEAYNRYIYLYGSSFVWVIGNARTITQQDLGGNVGLYGNRYISGETQQITISNLRIVKVQNTEWEQFKSKTFLYTLNQPLRSIGDTKDLLYIKNGMLYVDRKIGSVVLNGSENWYVYGQTYRINNFGAKPFSSFSTDNVLAYSNYFKWLNGNSSTFVEGAMWYTLSGNELCLQKNQSPTSTTLVAFKTWLSTHNTEVIYAIQNSTIEELGTIESPYSYQGDNIIEIDTGIDTTSEIDYYWKNYDVLFAGIVKNSGDISLKPTNPKYCSLQILDYKTFLSESDTLDFVISDKTIAEAISMVVDAIRGYGFILGTINISQADDIIGAYSTLNKTAYDVFQYLANISGSRWRARFVDSDTMAIDFYDPELLPRANDIDYTQQYWEDNKIVDLTFNYGTRDYRNKQIILSDEVYGGIDYTEVLLSNGYGTSYITQNNIANITSITVNGVEAEVITQSEKDLGVDADFYYTPGKNVVESTTSYTAGTQIIITYTPLVKGRQIVYNDEEVTRIATQTNTTGVISRYENRNDILSSDELENIAETYIKYKGKPEIILKLTTLNNDLFNIGEICYFNSPIADLAQDYMVKSKATNYTSVAGETNIFYTYELTSSFNSEKAINYFDNQRNKATGNIAEGESITRNIDINNSAMIIWENATITEISVSVDGDNALNSVLNSPFIQ